MKNWKSLKLGDNVVWTTREFGITQKTHAEITEIAEDHAIATEITEFPRKMNLWIDDDTQHMFEKE